jgi:hypothetical protein
MSRLWTLASGISLAFAPFAFAFAQQAAQPDDMSVGPRLLLHSCFMLHASCFMLQGFVKSCLALHRLS